MNRKRRRRAAAAITAMLLALSHLAVPAAAEGIPEAAAGQLSAAITLTETDLDNNTDTIRILLQQSIDLMGPDNPMTATLQSVMLLLDTGTADAASVSVLLKSVVDSAGELPGDAMDSQASTETADSEAIPETQPASETEPAPGMEPAPETQPASGTEPAQESHASIADKREPNEQGLPVYEVSSFIKAIMQKQVLVNVPGDWGNNASGRSLTSFSPVNDSGAISPAAGTLTISYFPMEGLDEETALETYAKNIADMSVTTSLTSEKVQAARLSGEKLYFTMTVGANQFTCETFCFAYQGTIYAIELMQGPQTTYDYFPMYDEVVDSAKVGDEEEIREAEAQSEAGIPVEPEDIDEPVIEETDAPVIEETDSQPAPETDGQIIEETDGQIIEETDQPTQETDAPPVPEEIVATGDIGTFQYALNGHTYQFPTRVADLAPEDLALNRSLTLPYDFSSDADMAGGRWTETVNTQYYYFENSLFKEMAGVTNMEGYPVPLSDGVVTALIDTQGDYINITLPGDVKVGSAESEILRGFPEFATMPMDGTAAFRTDANGHEELLYACNVRDDGCNGYVLIRNDDPFYSAVSMICENGIIKEISYECLGTVRAEGVFLY